MYKCQIAGCDRAFMGNDYFSVFIEEKNKSIAVCRRCMKRIRQVWKARKWIK